MKGFLLDANVISEAFKARRSPPVMRFLNETDPLVLFLSVLTLGELRRGAYQRSKRHPSQPNKLLAWTETIESDFRLRLLDVTAEVAERWAYFRAGRDRPIIDSLLVATASVHSLTMVTRNVKDFQNLGLTLFNPWEEQTRLS